jgi:hypothetical protein
MKVVFHTNLDKYSREHFPANMPFVPRIGETVHVIQSLKNAFVFKRLPTSLKVTNVDYYEDRVVVELSYSKLDVKFAKLRGVDLFN